MSTPKRKKSKRAVNTGPKSPEAQNRRKLYAHSFERISEARKQGFYLEAITLTESLIADRLEARLAAIHDQKPEKRYFSTLGNLTQELSGESAGETAAMKKIYDDVFKWAARRNKALHQMAKLAEGDAEKWHANYAASEKIADDGLKLFRQLDSAVKRLNKPASSPDAS